MVLRGNKTLCPSVWQRPIDLTIVHASQHWHLLLTHLLTSDNVLELIRLVQPADYSFHIMKSYRFAKPFVTLHLQLFPYPQVALEKNFCQITNALIYEDPK